MPATNPSAEEPVVPGLEDDEEGSRVVREELRLLATVQRAIDAVRKGEGGRAADTGDDARLLEIREEISVAKPEDLPALFEQMHTLGALRAQRGKSTPAASTSGARTSDTSGSRSSSRARRRRAAATCSSARART